MAASRRKSQNAADLHFSPVNKVNDRVSTSPQKGNLTGNPRIIRDNCAEWYNLRQKWVALTLEGSGVTQQIAAVKLQAVQENKRTSEDGEIGNQITKLQTDFPEELHKLCGQLEKITNNLQKVYGKMARMNQQLEGLQTLVTYQQTTSAGLTENVWFASEPVFHTWPVQKFYDSSNKLLAMHRRELDVKKRITETIAHCKDELVLNFLLSEWIHEAYIDACAIVELESMLIESGHRYL